jgi:Family of unknown function (DUF6460)
VNRITFNTILRILVASLLVGMAMAFFEVQPRDVLHWVTGGIDDALANAQAWIGWTVKYVLLGAVIVVPIWLLWYLLQFLRRR